MTKLRTINEMRAYSLMTSDIYAALSDRTKHVISLNNIEDHGNNHLVQLTIPVLRRLLRNLEVEKEEKDMIITFLNFLQAVTEEFDEKPWGEH